MADLNGNGNGRLNFAWVARSAVLLLMGLATWIAQETSATVDRIEERVRHIEIAVPSRYITREEAEALVAASETRIYRRIDLELGRPMWRDE